MTWQSRSRKAFAIAHPIPRVLPVITIDFIEKAFFLRIVVYLLQVYHYYYEILIIKSPEILFF
jgi:hypothetical protein